MSVSYNFIKKVELLLHYGANIHVGDNYALRWSARKGHVEIINLLLNKGAKINILDYYTQLQIIHHIGLPKFIHHYTNNLTQIIC